jgi:release factor glutamine methyltransferase
VDLASVTARLAAAGCVAPDAEAAELVAAAEEAGTLARWVGRRETGEPVAWITGTTVFAGRRLRIGPGAYVPRPQTEELARRAAAVLPAGGRALDLCTGIGAVAAHLLTAVPGATVVGVEIDRRAATWARRNGVATIVGDLATAVRGAFDVVSAVAPYVPTGDLRLLPADVQRFEPRRALDGGPDGLVLARRIVDASTRLLRPGGWLVVELGGEQDVTLAPDLAAAFDLVQPWHDTDGDLRGLAARRQA